MVETTPISSTRFHIGAKQLRGKLAGYAKHFDFLEVTVRLATGKASPEPTLRTLRQWRKQVPPHFDFCVVAGPAVGRLKGGPEFDAELKASLEALNALEARCFLLRTPADVTPAPLWRERLASLVKRLPTDATYVVWEPSGPWEVEEAGRFARRLGITLSVDAAREAVPPGNVAYARLRALGETRSFGPTALERVVRAIGPRKDAYVVIESDAARKQSARLRDLLLTGAPAVGGERLIRPRGGLRVSDDEQE